MRVERRSAKIDKPVGRSETQRQKQYFDAPRNQYPPARIVTPPLRTELELRYVLERLAGISSGARIVDFGSGTGRLTIPLTQAGYAVVAVDVSERSLAALRDTVRDLGLPSVETATTIPSGEAYPAIVGADVLHHVDLDEHLPSIRQSLANGGRAIFSEPGGFNPAWYLYLPLMYDMRIEKRVILSNPLALDRKFRAHGFRDVRITGMGLVPRQLLSWSARACHWHDRLGDKPVLRWFAYRYIIEATK